MAGRRAGRAELGGARTIILQDSCAQWKTPLTLTAKTRSISASVAFSTLPTAAMPALLIMTSTRLPVALIASNAAVTAAASATLHGMPVT